MMRTRPHYRRVHTYSQLQMFCVCLCVLFPDGLLGQTRKKKKYKPEKHTYLASLCGTICGCPLICPKLMALHKRVLCKRTPKGFAHSQISIKSILSGVNIFIYVSEVFYYKYRYFYLYYMVENGE